MQASWSLREEVNFLTGRWYLLVSVFLISGIAGWSIAFISPTDYEARANLSVAFNSDALFTSPDDYKNAQFEEVTDLVLSDALLDKVVLILRDEGDEWQDWDRDDLRVRFSVKWRNAGQWQLVVRDRDQTRAMHLALIWRDAAIQLVTGAIVHAENFYQLDLALKTTLRAQGEINREMTRLQTVDTAVRAWLSELEGGPVSERKRAELKTLGREVSSFDIPEGKADYQAYKTWAEELLVALETDHDLLAAQDQVLRERIVSLSDDWLAEKTASQGLSAFLSVNVQQASLVVSEVRSPAIFTLVSGWAGTLGWLGFRLIKAGIKSTAWKDKEKGEENR